MNKISFNSLQTGKGIQSMKAFSFFQGRLKVSIPFKRERVSKGENTRTRRRQTQLVSIPFKRERVSKEQILHGISR